MKHLADALMFTRIGLALFLLGWAATAALGWAGDMNYALVLWIAAIAFLTDAFDGICARRWPYSDKERASRPWHTTPEDSHNFDNAGDLAFYLALGISLVAHDYVWLKYLLLVMAGALVLFLAVQLLKKLKSKYAETVDVVFGWLFGLTLGGMLCYVAALAYPHQWGWIVALGVVVTLMMLPSKWDRLTSRPESRVSA